jgi:hypothetical protein
MLFCLSSIYCTQRTDGSVFPVGAVITTDSVPPVGVVIKTDSVPAVGIDRWLGFMCIIIDHLLIRAYCIVWIV